MALLANVALTNTFDEWRTRTNQIIVGLDVADTKANNAYNRANTGNMVAFLASANAQIANATAMAAFAVANTGNMVAYLASVNVSIAYTKANTANQTAELAYLKANAANVLAFTSNTTATQALTTALAALPNTSGVTFAGDLTFTGSVKSSNIHFNTTGSVRMDRVGAGDIVRLTANAFRVAVGTNSRPTGEAGLIRYNTDTGKLETYNASTWAAVSSLDGVAITDDTSTNSLFYPTLSSVTSGSALAMRTSSSKLTFNPAVATLSVPNVAVTTLTATNYTGTGVATSTEFRTKTAAKVLTNTSVWDAMAEVVMSIDAGTGNVAWDLNAGYDFYLQLTQNVNLLYPTNLKAGQKGRLLIVQDATGGRTLSVASNFLTIGGVTPVISTTAGAVDIFYYDVRSDTVSFILAAKGVS